MKTKKITALVVALLFCFVIFTGCTSSEKDYNNLIVEMSSLKAYSTEGNMTIHINSGEKDADILNNVFENLKVSYESKVDYDKNIAQSKYYLEGANGLKTGILSITMKEDKIFIKTKELGNLIKQYDTNGEMAKLVKLLETADYLTISQNDLNNLQKEYGNTQPEFMQNELNIKNQYSKQLMAIRFLDSLVNKGYVNYESGLVKKEGSKYTLSINQSDLSAKIQPFLTYSVNNFDVIGGCLIDFLEGLTPEEMAIQKMDEQVKMGMISGIKQGMFFASTNKEDIVEGVSQATEEIDNDLEKSQVKFQIRHSIEKQNDKFINSGLFEFFIPNEEGDISFSIKANDITSKSGAGFEVENPTGKIIGVNEFEKKLTKDMTLNINTKEYSFREDESVKNGVIDGVRMINGSTYVPARQIGELFGEKISYDQKGAFAVQNGERIDLKGQIIEGRTYVKVRDFEKMDYNVKWNAANKTMKLTKWVLK